MRRSGQVLLTAVLLLLLLLLLADASSSSQFRPRESHEREGKRSGGGHMPWMCCDRCGGCTKSTPPRCQCQDLVPSCHPLCRNCVQSPLSVEPPMYQCMDRIPNYCKRTCAPASLAGA